MAAGAVVGPLYLQPHKDLLGRLDAKHVFQRQFSAQQHFDIQTRKNDGSIEIAVTSGPDVIAMVKLQSAPDSYIESGKLFLFRVLSFEKSGLYETTIQTLQKLHRIYLDLNQSHKDIFQMEIVEDTSKDLIFTRQDQPFLQEFGPLDSLYVVYWVARGKTAVQEVGDFVPRTMMIDDKKTMATAENKFGEFQNSMAGTSIPSAQRVFTFLRLITKDAPALNQQIQAANVDKKNIADSIAKLKKDVKKDVHNSQTQLDEAERRKTTNADLIVQLKTQLNEANKEWSTITHKNVCQAVYNRIGEIKRLPRNGWNAEIHEEMELYRHVLQYYKDTFKNQIFFQLVTGKYVHQTRTIPLHIFLKKTHVAHELEKNENTEFVNDCARYNHLLKNLTKDENYLNELLDPILDVMKNTELSKNEIRQLFGPHYDPRQFSLKDLRKFEEERWKRCVENVVQYMDDEFPYSIDGSKKLFKNYVLNKIKDRVVSDELANEEPEDHYVKKQLSKFVQFIIFKDEHGDLVKSEDYIDIVRENKTFRPELLDILNFSKKLVKYKTLLQHQDVETQMTAIWKRVREWVNHDSKLSSGSETSKAVYNAYNKDPKSESFKRALITYRVEVCTNFDKRIVDFVLREGIFDNTQRKFFTETIKPKLSEWFKNYYHANFNYVDNLRPLNNKEKGEFKRLVEPFLQFCALPRGLDKEGSIANRAILDINRDYITVVIQTKIWSNELNRMLDTIADGGGRGFRRRSTLRKRRC